MGTYKQYTLKQTVPLPVTFKCPNCQNDNVIMHPFFVQTQYNDKGTFTKSGLQEREKQAKEMLSYEAKTLYANVYSATESRRFKNAGYTCYCNHCKQFPLWSNFRVKALDNIAAIACFVSIVLALIWVKELFGTPLPVSELLPAVAVFCLGNLPAFLAYTIKGCKIRAMDKAYMPKVYKDVAEFQQAMTGNQN